MTLKHKCKKCRRDKKICIPSRSKDDNGLCERCAKIGAKCSSMQWPGDDARNERIKQLEALAVYTQELGDRGQEVSRRNSYEQERFVEADVDFEGEGQGQGDADGMEEMRRRGLSDYAANRGHGVVPRLRSYQEDDNSAGVKNLRGHVDESEAHQSRSECSPKMPSDSREESFEALLYGVGGLHDENLYYSFGSQLPSQETYSADEHTDDVDDYGIGEGEKMNDWEWIDRPVILSLGLVWVESELE